MSKQPENEALTSQELREALLAELEASKQVIAELSVQELTHIQGGGYKVWKLGDTIRKNVREGRVLQRTQSAPARLQKGEFRANAWVGSDSPGSDFEVGQGVSKVKPL